MLECGVLCCNAYHAGSMHVICISQVLSVAASQAQVLECIQLLLHRTIISQHTYQRLFWLDGHYTAKA